jgi:hypothetical protein
MKYTGRITGWRENIFDARALGAYLGRAGGGTALSSAAGGASWLRRSAGAAMAAAKPAGISCRPPRGAVPARTTAVSYYIIRLSFELPHATACMTESLARIDAYLSIIKVPTR